MIARKHGGQTVIENLALSCLECNRYKGSDLSGIDPETGLLAPLFHPRRQVWEEHFLADGPLLLGRSEAGRATVVLLRLNEPRRVELRLALQGM